MTEMVEHKAPAGKSCPAVAKTRKRAIIGLITSGLKVEGAGGEI